MIRSVCFKCNEKIIQEHARLVKSGAENCVTESGQHWKYPEVRQANERGFDDSNYTNMSTISHKNTMSMTMTQPSQLMLNQIMFTESPMTKISRHTEHILKTWLATVRANRPADNAPPQSDFSISDYSIIFPAEPAFKNFR